MKPKHTSPFVSSLINGRSTCAATLLFSLVSCGVAVAASQTWTGGGGSSLFTAAGNWSGGAVPGATYVSGNSVNADVITFNSALVGGTIGGVTDPIQIDLNRLIGGITFSGAAAGPYVIGSTAGNELKVSHNGTIQVASDVVTAQIINAPIAIRLPSSTNGVYTIQNNATDSNGTLTFGGNIVANPNSTTRPMTLTLAGSNTGTNAINGNLTTLGTKIDLIKSGAGTWILAGTNDFGSNSSATNAGSVTINGGVLSVRSNAGLSTNSTANSIAVAVNSTGILELANSITLDNGVSLNLNTGGLIRSSGSTTTNGRINVGTAAATSVTLSAVGSSDVFTIGNGTNDLTGGAADSVINITGPGTVFQNVASNYAGGWSINSGTLKLGSTTALGTTGTSIKFGASSTGKLQLNGNSVTIGSLSSDATPGTPVIENGVAGTVTLSVGGAAGTTFAGVLQDGAAGSLALSKSGTGTLNLTGANTYSGSTNVSAGTLKLNNSSGSATGSSAVTVNGTGVLGGSGTMTGLVNLQSGGTIAPGNSVGDLTVGSLTASTGSIFNFEFNGATNDRLFVTDSNGLTLNGGGFNIFTEGGTSGYSTVGTYNLINYSGTLGGSVGVLATLNPVAGYNYTYGTNAGWVTLDIAAAGVISNWNVDADGSWNTVGNWSGGVPNAAGDSANFTSAITAPRTVTLDGAKTVGGVSFNNAQGYTLAQGSGGSLTLDGNGSQASLVTTSGSHTISAPVILNSTTVSSVDSGASLTVSGVVSGANSLTKSGAGDMILTATNSYSGGTSVTGGNLTFSSGSLGSGNLMVNGGVIIYGAGNTDDLSSTTFSIGILGGTVNTNGNDVTFANAIGNGGLGSLVKSGMGVLTMQGNNTFSGTTTVSGGSLVIVGTSASTGGTTLNGANTMLAVGSDGGLGAVPGVAATNLTLNPGSGNSATLKVSSTFSMNANRNVSLASGTAIIDTNGNNLTIAGNVSGSGLLNKSGAGNLTLTGANSGTATGGITIDSGIVFTNDQSNLPSGTITLNGTAGISNGSNAANYNNVVVNGTNSIVKTGSNNIIGLGNLSGGGNLTFGGTYVNDFTGNMSSFTGTIIANGGGSRWNGSTGGANVTLDLGGTGSSVRSSAAGITLGALVGSSTASLSGAAGGPTQAVTYTIGGKTVGGLGLVAVNSTFDGAITNGANATGLTKVGLSTLTLNGTSSYTGATTVSAGTLLVNGSLGNTAVSVNSGGTLGGTNGTIGTGTASVTVNSGGTLAPGSSPGALTINGSTTLNSGSTFAFEYTGGGAGASTDIVEVNGTLSINSATLTLVDLGSYTLWDKFTLFSYESLTGTFSGLADDSVFTANGGDWLINYDDATAGLNGGSGANYVTITAVPEPATALLGGLGMLALLRRRRN